jgi:hypothetical protein
MKLTEKVKILKTFFQNFVHSKKYTLWCTKHHFRGGGGAEKARWRRKKTFFSVSPFSGEKHPILGRHNIQHSDTHHNDIQHNDAHHNKSKDNSNWHSDAQHDGLILTLGINDTQHNDSQHDGLNSNTWHKWHLA